jgi:O-acetyl-ADP-ribose deacetylase (regulator of RNase III)
MSERIARLVQALQSHDLDPIAEEVADLIWLAQHIVLPARGEDDDRRHDQPADADTANSAEEGAGAPAIDLSQLPQQDLAADDPATAQVFLPGADGSGMAEASGGMSFRSPAGAALPGALEIARALRPLMRRVPSRTNMVLDAEATVQRIADEKIWAPRLRPANARWLELALVIDESQSMAIWQRTIAELRRLLERHGAFRDVRTWGLVTDAADGKAQLRAGIGPAARARPIRSARELIDPAGRRLILIVSDCVAPAWYASGQAGALLQTWAEHGPVALVQVLPERLWVRCGLGDALPATLRAPAPGVANARLSATPALRMFGRAPADRLKIPVLTLDDQPIKEWARLVAGAGGATADGRLLRAPAASAPAGRAPSSARSSDAMSAAQRVEQFMSAASDQAYELAELLACVPLSLPVMRLVQETLLPAARQIHLAEVFLGGLIQSTTPNPESADPDTVQYEFLPGVRERLRAHMSASKQLDALRRISARVASEPGQSDFMALIEDAQADGAAPIAAGSLPFAAVAASVLRRFGGKYADLAQRLAGSSEPQPAPPRGAAAGAPEARAVQVGEGVGPEARRAAEPQPKREPARKRNTGKTKHMRTRARRLVKEIDQLRNRLTAAEHSQSIIQRDLRSKASRYDPADLTRLEHEIAEAKQRLDHLESEHADLERQIREQAKPQGAPQTEPVRGTSLEALAHDDLEKAQSAQAAGPTSQPAPQSWARSFRISHSTLELIDGDIVEQDVDAIVTSTVRSLYGSGQLDKAIHAAAGPELLEECLRIGNCPVGQARITRGYRLQARHVIHAVGPTYSHQTQDQALLASAYHSSLALASANGVRTIAFPSISAGMKGYPIDEVATIALRTIQAYLEQHSEIVFVRIIVQGASAQMAYEHAAREVLGTGPEASPPQQQHSVAPDDAFSTEAQHPSVLAQADGDAEPPSAGTPAQEDAPSAVLGVEPDPAATTSAPSDARLLNCWIEGVGPGQPLNLNTTYELSFNVGPKRADSLTVAQGASQAALTAAGSHETATVLVVVEPGDFTVYGVDSLEVVVPKAIDRPSKNTATFTIEPKKAGPSRFEALVYINGSRLQDVRITLQVESGQAASSADIPAPTNMPEAKAGPAAPIADTRVINCWIEGLQPNQPLEPGAPYQLRFDVGAKRGDAIATVGGVGRALREAAGDAPLATLLVVLEPGDFTIYGVDALEIAAPRDANAPSKNSVAATIEAKKTGSHKLNLIFYINGRLFQKVECSIHAGEQPAPGEKAVQAETTGLTLSSAIYLPKRPPGQPVNIAILAKEAGYRMIVQAGGVARAFLNISAEELAGLIKRTRGVWHEIINTRDQYRNSPYNDTMIAPEVHAHSLRKLAALGMFLFDELFYGNSGPDARAIGDMLRHLARSNKLHLQITAERFPFPWTFLYHGDDPDNPDPNDFWGFKHIIDYLPEFSANAPINFAPAIEADGALGIAFVCDTAIDKQFHLPIVQGQREAFKTLPSVNVKDYLNIQDFIDLIKDPQAPPLIYLFCQTHSTFPNEGEVENERLKLSDGWLTLRDLKRRVRASLPALRQAPLVFLACGSVETTPYLYEALLPYLIGRGARGMIGAEVQTPVPFAAAFATEFMRHFTAGGVTAGELLLDLRRSYLQQRNNVLGLAYALYASGDIIIQRQDREAS